MEIQIPITTEIVTSINQGLAEELSKLYVQTFTQLPVYAGRNQLCLDAITKEIQLFNKSDNSRHAIIAKDNGQVIGLIFIDLLKDKIMYLAQGVISKSYQGQGVAKEMLKAFLTLHSYVTGAIVLTREGNDAAVRLYEEIGAKNLEIYTQHPFLKARGYQYPPFIPFKIPLSSIKKHYPEIRFKFSETNDAGKTSSREKYPTPIRSNL
jgi:ribosomal protein S18 acetylase RimI-like enzyme